MSFILNIETSTDVCSIALSRNGRLIDIFEDTEGMNHARLTAYYIQEILKCNNLKVGELAAIAVSQGPGSYTGLRIGVSLAKGLCYAHHLPLIAVSPLMAMSSWVAGNLDKADICTPMNVVLCPMIDARRMEVYMALYDTDLAVIEDVSAKVIDKDTFCEITGKQLVLFGNGAEKVKSMLNQSNIHFIADVKTSADHMCVLSYKMFENKNFEDVAYFEPYYLKDFIAGKPKRILKD